MEEKMTKKFRSFEDARKFVQLQNIQTKTQWEEYCKSGNKPDDIPSNPQLNYKNYWKGYGDWLRDGKKSERKSNFLPFDEARKFVQTLKLKDVDEWRDYCKSGNKPYNITSVPERVYKNKGWSGLGDWLGTGRVAMKNRKYRSFEDSKKFVQTLNLKSEKQWNQYCKSGNKPEDIPQSPKQVYKNQYLNMGDWLGTGRVADRLKQFLSFEDARKFARSLKLKSYLDWQKFYRVNRPKNLPKRPDNTYKNKGWKDWGDFLGTGTISTTKKSNEFLSFREAKKFIQTLGSKNQREWIEYCASGKRPVNIPSNPHQVYSKRRTKK